MEYILLILVHGTTKRKIQNESKKVVVVVVVVFGLFLDWAYRRLVEHLGGFACIIWK